MGCDQPQETIQIAKPLELPAAPCSFYYHKVLKKNIYTKVEIEAEYGEGTAAYQRFLNKNLRYPNVDNVDPNEWQTRVDMEFIVDTDGLIKYPGIHNKIDTSAFTPFEKEAVRVLKLMSKWAPALCQGKPVASLVNKPIIVHLESE
jgi:protein TonB